MILNPSLVAERYAATRAATQPQPGTEGGLVTQALSDFARTMAAGDQAAIGSMTGGTDPHALVQALAQTELAIETAVTVRNKVVEAYQEILRMPV